MKYKIFNLTAAAVLALAGAGAGQTALGQASVQMITSGQGSTQTTTTTSDGTISEFSPDTIIVKTQDAAEPVRYSYSKSTTYVDESGNPVSMETVKSGLPVTVYYVKDGDNLVASKVIVKTSVIQPAPVVQDSKTTTTTTTEK
jgi:CRISPR/Cas system-associated exonuclease Cas4 (RecB family)